MNKGFYSEILVFYRYDPLCFIVHFVSLTLVIRSPSITFNVNVKRSVLPLYIEEIGFGSLHRFTFRQSPPSDRYPTEIFDPNFQCMILLKNVHSFYLFY